MAKRRNGYIHTVLAVHFNCDYRSLRFVVEGEKFCNISNQNSWFGEFDPNRGGLRAMQKLLNRIIDKKDSSKLLIESHKVDTKIIELSETLVCSSKEEEIIANTADLVYYSMLFLEKNNIDIIDVEKELIKWKYIVVKKDLKCLIGDENVFTIGIVGSHCNESLSIDFLNETFKTKIEKVIKSGRNYVYRCENQWIKIVIVKSKDINTLLTNGFIDAILCYEDLILNSSLFVEKLVLNNVEQRSTKIVIACKEHLNFDDLLEINKKRKIIIMAEYMKFACDWVRDKQLNANIIHVHGTSESYLVNDICDFIVAVCDTGTILNENYLKILDVLSKTAMFLFVNPEKKYKLDLIKN